VVARHGLLCNFFVDMAHNQVSLGVVGPGFSELFHGVHQPSRLYCMGPNLPGSIYASASSTTINLWFLIHLNNIACLDIYGSLLYRLFHFFRIGIIAAV
jgi:hypothetical protein